MVTIKVIPNIGLNFGEPINELVRVWTFIEQNRNEKIIIDLSDCRFSNPFFLLGIYLLYRHCKHAEIDIELNSECSNDRFAAYLNLTYFRGGFQPDNYSPGEYNNIFDSYIDKTYLPLTNFPAGASNIDADIRDRMLELMRQRIGQHLNLSTQLFSAVTYLIDEAVNNIKDHARTERGYLFTQFYPRKEILDVCIADTGVTILGSYEATGRNDIISHEQAIQSALAGDSTKDDPNRGFGIRTSRRMLVNGLGGRYFLMSGNTFIYSRSGFAEEINVLPPIPALSWPGTYIAMRIPVQQNVNFKIIDYLE
jgi:hypothetical protein